MTEQPTTVENAAVVLDRLRKPRAFKVGQRVKYIPLHAHGDATHPDCEIGEVTHINNAGVFVRFTEPHVRHWPQCCDPSSLVRVQ